MNERELIQKAKDGDHQAFLALLEKYDRQIMSVVYRFTGNLYDREDLYQEIFLRCFQAIKSFRFRSAFSTWLYRVALNRTIDYMRRKPLPDLPSQTLADPPDWEQRARLAVVRRALSRVRGPQHICFHLFYIEGWEIRDIMDVLGCSEGTVKSHLNRARSKIKKDFEVLQWQTSLN